MSARRRDADARPAPPPAGGPDRPPVPARRLTDADATLRPRRSLVSNLAVVLGAFAGVTVVAELLGAANLGTALSFGQIGFAIALVYVLVRR